MITPQYIAVYDQTARDNKAVVSERQRTGVGATPAGGIYPPVDSVARCSLRIDGLVFRQALRARNLRLVPALQAIPAFDEQLAQRQQ
jgi:hypothetical protein